MHQHDHGALGLGAAHDPAILALSLLLAAVAAYTALDLADRAGGERGPRRAAWLACAAGALGGGVWAMHFTAMLAMSLPIEVRYSAGTTALSLLVALLTTGAAFLAVGLGAATAVSIVAAGAVMGVGVTAMHYLGMTAIDPAVSMEFQPGYVVAATLVGFAASTTALWISMRMRTSVPTRLLAAAAMGVGIYALHHVAMMGTALDVVGPHEESAGEVGRQTLAASIGAISLLVLLLGISAATADRTLGRRTKEGAEAVAAERDYTRMLIRSSPDGIIGFDREMRVTEWNPAQEAASGVSRADALGRQLGDVLPRIRASRSIEGARASLHGRTSVVEDSVRYEDGRVAHWSASFAPMLGPDGSVRGGIVHVRPTTELRRLEESLRQSQKMEAMGQLTSGIVHDFNNILQVMTSCVTLLERGRPPEAIRGGMQEAIERGRALTQQLLGFSRRRSLNPVPLLPAERVSRMAQMLSSSMRNGARLEVVEPMGAWSVEADPDELGIALLNLCVNAADAAPGGKVRIRVSDETVAHGVGERVGAGDYVRIAVSDDGTGMTPEVAAKAFEPFFTSKEHGTGLGLSQVYGFARRSGGSVDIHTFPNAGTTVSIRLPRSRAADRREAA